MYIHLLISFTLYSPYSRLKGTWESSFKTLRFHKDTSVPYFLANSGDFQRHCVLSGRTQHAVRENKNSLYFISCALAP